MKGLFNRSNRGEIILLGAVLLLVEFVRGAVAASFIPIYGEKTLGLSLDVVGTAITAHFLTDTALKMVIGWLLDRFSARTIVHGGLLASLAGVALMQYADVPWLFIASAALFGIGISPIWIVCLTKVTEERRATQMGLLYTIWFIGIGSGPIACNLLLDHAPLVAGRLIVAVTALSWALSLMISNRRERRIGTMTFSRQAALLRGKLYHMRALLPGMILQTMGAGMLLPVLPAFAEKELGVSSSTYSLILLAAGGLTVLALMPMGRLSDRLGHKRAFLTIGFCAFSVLLFLLAAAPPFWQCLLIAGALGIAYSAVLPAWNALLASYLPKSQEGLGWGIFSTLEGIGIMIGPAAGGVIASLGEEADVIWTAAALFGSIGLFYLLYPLRPPEQPAGPAPAGHQPQSPLEGG